MNWHYAKHCRRLWIEWQRKKDMDRLSNWAMLAGGSTAWIDSEMQDYDLWIRL
jgi:hypothetical protein